MADDELKVEFSVKELLTSLRSDVTTSLSRVEGKIDAYASRVERLEDTVNTLVPVVQKHEEKLAQLEVREHVRQGVMASHKVLWGIIGTALGAGASVAIVLSVFVH